MLLDLLVTVLASIVIGWNIGSWVLPAFWLAAVCLALSQSRRNFLTALSRIVPKS
jgi:hypothetical protein